MQFAMRHVYTVDEHILHAVGVVHDIERLVALEKQLALLGKASPAVAANTALPYGAAQYAVAF